MPSTLLWKAPLDAARNLMAHNSMQMAAALAYFAVFSLGPILLILVSIAGLVWGRQAAQGEIVDRLSGVVGDEAAAQLETMIAAAHGGAAGAAGAAIGAALLLVGATGVLVQLKNALNRIWSAKSPPGRGFIRLVRDRLLAVGLILIAGFVLLASLAASAILSALAARVGEALPAPMLVMRIAEVALSLIVVTVLIAALFKFLPDVETAWRDVLVGAVMTAMLFLVGRSLLGLYLGTSAIASAHGAAGSLVAILMWVYYSSLILLYGAELTQVRASRRAPERRASGRASSDNGDARGRLAHRASAGTG